MESIEISPKNIRQLSNISADELNALLKTKKISNLLIDVRSTQEFNGLNGHIKETKSLPFNLLLKNMNLLKDYKDYKIVTICNGGGLSLMAGMHLKQAGFKDVNNLIGGMSEWIGKGYPVVVENNKLNGSPTEETLENNLENSPTGKILDSKGKLCPIPVIWTKKALKTMEPGETLKLIADDPGSLIYIPALLKKTGNNLVNINKLGSDIEFTIQKGI